MATPAEIIAARINGFGSSVGNKTSEGSNTSKDPVSDQTTKVTSITDENAFPVLGGGVKLSNGSTCSSSWGPNLNSSSAPALAGLKHSNGQTKLKTSTVQEAFSLDAEDQLNVSRPEFVKILTSIKASTSAGIECTSSQHTRKRTFLITGKPEQVKLAKRLVIKRLSKPIVTSFAIPAKIRSKVIGSQGRTLKPIIQQTEVKIEIGNWDKSSSPELDDDDVFAQTVNVVLEGDAESCKMAKDLIMDIVREETKTAQTKIVINEMVKPFAGSVIKHVAAKYPQLEITAPPLNSSSKSILLMGDRESLFASKEELTQALASFESELVIELVPIPKVKFQFLPVEQILEEDSVYIKIPTDDEGDVQFIGRKQKIASAKDKAKRTTSRYKVESLDMSKAHKGNLSHVRAVASMLNKYGFFALIATENDVQIQPPSDEFLLNENNTLIPVVIIVKADASEAIKNSRRAVVAAVNAVSTEVTKIVSDIDPFFMAAAADVLDAFSGVKYVIINNIITLFDVNETTTGEDFEDFNDRATDCLIEADRALNPFRSLQERLVGEVLQIPSKDQKYILGPHGATLKALLALLENNAVQVTLHHNANESSKDEVLVKGYKGEVAKISQEISAILEEVAEYKESGYSTTVNFPAFVLARFIGKGGANLKEVMDEFNVEIDVSGESKGMDKNDKLATVEIVIKGIKRNADAANAKVTSLGKKLADDTLVRLKIENQYHKRISGPSFSSINRLREKYNVVIRFPSDTAGVFSDRPQNPDEIVIRGLSRNVAKAQEELMQLYQFEKENGFKTTLQIPRAAIGRVIGKNGENIKDISDATGAEIFFRERNGEEEFAEVDIVGSKFGLKEATQKIQSIIEEIENTVTTTLKVNRKYLRDIVGQGGSVLRALITKAGGDQLPRQQYAKLVTIPSNTSESDEIVFKGDKTIVDRLVREIQALVTERDAAVTDFYELIKEKHRFLVGSYGSVRRSLEEEYGVQLIIPKPNEDSTKIHLVGLPEKIEQLKAKIDELTKDNWKVSIDVPLAYHALVSDNGSLFPTLRQTYNVEVSHGNLSRKAFKALESIPQPPPAEAAGGDEATKFTIVALEALADDSQVIPWRLIGSDEDTKAATKIIESRLEAARTATNAAWFYSRTPSVHFPKIVGPHGTRIKKIRESTGCLIIVPRDSHKYNNYVYLKGTSDDLRKANEQIQKLM